MELPSKVTQKIILICQSKSAKQYAYIISCMTSLLLQRMSSQHETSLHRRQFGLLWLLRHLHVEGQPQRRHRRYDGQPDARRGGGRCGTADPSARLGKGSSVNDVILEGIVFIKHLLTHLKCGHFCDYFNCYKYGLIRISLTFFNNFKVN